MQTLRDFRQHTFLLPRCALLVALAAAGCNLASFGGLTMRDDAEWGALMHLTVMALFFAMVGRIAYHHTLSIRWPGLALPRTAVPRPLVWATVIAFIYLVGLFGWLGSTYSAGAPEVRGAHEVWVVRDTVTRALPAGSVATFEARVLRLFSAAWLFFALLVARVGHVVETRIRAYRAAARQAVA